jgi:branched-chain amino acid transport system substrate-binding protein
MWVGITMVIFSCFFAVQCFAAGRGVSKDTIKIGFVTSVTGPAAVYGKAGTDGYKNYFGYINDKGGIRGRKIELLVEDDQFDATKSVAAVNRLIHRDQVLTVISMGGTNETIANSKNINEFKISCIPNSTMREYYEPYKPYIFPVGATYDVQGKCMVDYIFNDLKGKNPRIGVVYANREYGKLGLEGARAQAKAYGVDLVSELVLPTGAPDYSSQVLTLQKNNVDYVLIWDIAPTVIPYLKTAEKYNYKPKATIGFNFATDPLVVAACGEAARDFLGATYVASWTDNAPGPKLARELAIKNNSNVTVPSIYFLMVGSAMFFVEAMERAGMDLNPDTLKAAFETFRNFETGGLLPPATYTSDNHSPPDMVKFYKADVPNKGLVPISDWRGARKMK